MGNTLITPTVIANETLMWWKNSRTFSSGASHEYDDRFDKIGDTYNMRDAVRLAAIDGPDITNKIQDVKESTKPLVINTQKTVPFKFSSKELTLTIDRFSERYIKPVGVALANVFDTDGLTLAYKTCPNIVGTPGTTPATAKVFLDAGVKMDNAACPMDDDRYVVINPVTGASMVDALKALNNQAGAIGRQYIRGRMGTALGFDWGVTQNIRTHTMGTAIDNVLVNGATQTGAVLKIDGCGNAGTVKAGTKFTIAGCNAVNPITGDDLGVLLQFTVLADATATAGGAIDTLSIYPAIVTSGPTKTVSAGPADDAAITFVGAAGAKYPMNLAYHKQAFVYGTVTMAKPDGAKIVETATDPDTGLSVRIVGFYDGLKDDVIYRADVLYGWAARRPEWACVVVG